MEPLLLLVHRIPFPPNKGDKVRSYHLLKHLAQHYSVYLGAFVDDNADWQYEGQVDSLCAEKLLLPLSPAGAKLRSMKGLITGQALSLPYYSNAQMHRWVREVLQRTGLKKAIVFSSAMAQYLMGKDDNNLCRVLDFVDVDSDKWKQYSQKRGFPMSWVYRREANKLLQFERKAASHFDASVFVSPREAGLFAELAPESAPKITYVNNGVDTEYFQPNPTLPNPYNHGGPVLAFTGAMDYWANAEAVEWFTHSVLSEVRQRHPDLRFAIVGSNPSDSVLKLAQVSGVQVSGSVPDIRPWLQHADIAVAPLRIARGVQNKVLEAMAMAKPVVATAQALEGIEPTPMLQKFSSNNPSSMCEAICSLISRDDRETVGNSLRGSVLQHYQWSQNLSRIDLLLDSRPTASSPPLAAHA